MDSVGVHLQNGLSASWRVPFPVRGSDILALACPTGEEVSDR